MASRPEVAVGAIVVHDGCLLLVRRRLPPGEGRWCPPGGRVEFGESLRAAVEREVLEETGIVVRTGELVGVDEDTGVDPDPYHFVILDFDAVAEGDTRLVAGDDAVDARWVPLAEVADLDLVEGLYDFLIRVDRLHT
jgi:8-oxo-dGTP diphosphatase